MGTIESLSQIQDPTHLRRDRGADDGRGLTPLTNATILRFYAPLAMSWLFMATESPIAVAAVSRLPDPKVQTAGFLIMMSLSLWIEGPVIDLLSTSTTLTRDRKTNHAMRRFTILMMIWVTLVHGLVAFTPAYDWVCFTLLNLRPEVAQAAHPGFAVMLPWSACIGWRRYHQGILIRHGLTKTIGAGTALRVATMSVVALIMFLTGRFTGVQTAACAILTSVIVEAAFVHVVSQPVIARHLSQDDPTVAPLEMRRLTAFHLPLTATTVMNLMGTPIISGALARSPDAVLALAAYQVANSVIWMHRTIAFGLPEVIITLARDEQSTRKLRDFCIAVGLLSSGLMLISALTGLDEWIFRTLLRAQPEVAQVASLAFVAMLLTPLINSVQSYLRGMLTAHHQTVSRLWAILVFAVTLVGVLVLGVRLQWPGVVTAGAAMTIALLAESAVLLAFWRRHPRKVAVSNPA